MKTWTHLTLPCPPSHQDLLIARLELLGLTGFVQTDDAVETYVASNAWNPALRRGVRAAAKRVLRKAVRLNVAEIPDQNWNAAWERSMKIVHATDRITIRPSWKRHKRKTKNEIVITIDPKMSFGTGHHETTRVCLKLLENYVQKGMTVLDFGTGSGVLAIAALKLGARKVDAVDNDKTAVENAEENVELNRVRSKKREVRRGNVRVVKGSVRSIPGKRYDLVVANIDLPTIKKTLRQLLDRTKRGGLVILSGLLLTDLVPLLEMLLRLPVEPVMLESEGEWIGMALTKSGRR